jgi:hypothetical protein
VQDRRGQFCVFLAWLTRNVLTILAVVGLAACIPVLRESYYRPEAEGATLAPSRCGGGPEDTATFTIDAVRVGYGLAPRDDVLQVLMSFLVPDGRTVRLLGTRLTVQPSGHEGEVRFIQQGWQGVGRGPLFADQAMVGKTKEDRWQKFQGHAFYVANARIALKPPADVTVTFPGFTIDDRIIDVRLIRFRLDRHVQFLAPINC